MIYGLAVLLGACFAAYRAASTSLLIMRLLGPLPATPVRSSPFVSAIFFARGETNNLLPEGADACCAACLGASCLAAGAGAGAASFLAGAAGAAGAAAAEVPSLKSLNLDTSSLFSTMIATT